jgi:hypothetical protein
MVNPCESCLQPATVTGISGGLEAMSATLAERVDELWQSALPGTEVSEALLQSGVTPAKAAEIDQQVTEVFDRTAKLTMIQAEMTGLIGGALEAADQIDCDATKAEIPNPTACPRILHLLGINNDVQRLVRDAVELTE